MFRFASCLAVLVVLVGRASADTVTHGTTTITMDFVSVGNAGNDPDTRYDTPGYGGVDYTYRIGTYEVTENQWDAVVAADTEDLLDDPGYWSGDWPVASISWHDAAKFCNWLTSGDATQGAYAINGSGEVTGIDRAIAVATYGTVYVIPTVDEWHKAAHYDAAKPGGPGYWDYPTRDDDPSPPDGIDFEEDPVFDAVFRDGHNQGHPNDVDNAGVLSGYGTMGQGGNVWEWTETANGPLRRQRGGDWNSADFVLHASYHVDHEPTCEMNHIGFRVASVPEPGSIALLVCGAVGLLGCGWRKRRRG